MTRLVNLECSESAPNRRIESQLLLLQNANLLPRQSGVVASLRLESDVSSDRFVRLRCSFPLCTAQDYEVPDKANMLNYSRNVYFLMHIQCHTQKKIYSLK